MSNLSNLQRNIIQALDCDISAAGFLRACDKTTVQAAERFAYEVRALVSILQPSLQSAADGHGCDVPSGLLKFILDRHWFWRHG